MIEDMQGFPDDVVAFACRGHVTAHEYQAVLMPRVEQALQQHDKVRVYYQVDDDFTGIEPGAVWEDIKVGMQHRRHWDRIAVVTDVDWIRNTMRAFGFLMPCEMRIFPTTERARARDWITSR